MATPMERKPALGRGAPGGGHSPENCARRHISFDLVAGGQ